jgi:hypothetical protein
MGCDVFCLLLCKLSETSSNVTGYSLSQIEANVLPGCDIFDTLIDELKDHKPSGVKDDQLDELFSNF